MFPDGGGEAFTMKWGFSSDGQNVTNYSVPTIVNPSFAQLSLINKANGW